MEGKIKIGGHLRSGEGLKHVPLEARALGYGLVQIMLSDELAWNPMRIGDADAAEYRKMMYGITTYVHLPFIINPCAEEDNKRNYSRVVFRKFASAASSLGVKTLVLHAGFKKEQTDMQALQIAKKFFVGLLKDDMDIEILLEVDSGSKNGSRAGSLEFCCTLIRELRMPELGLCLDTAHLFARGVDLWDERERDNALVVCGRHLRLIHLNVPDPNVELGGNLDRHNTAFADYPRDSSGLVSRMLDWPCILERRSLAVQEQDMSYIRALGKI